MTKLADFVEYYAEALYLFENDWIAKWEIDKEAFPMELDTEQWFEQFMFYMNLKDDNLKDLL